jgi:steroid 5-alpha reductase family enzyme
MDSNLSIFLTATAWTFAVTTVIWVVALLAQGNHSMMDAYYGFGYAVPVWIAFFLSDAASPIAALLLLMASMHGCRLGFYLAARWRRYVPVYGGDPRYLDFKTKYSPGYWWKSFFAVMEPQAVLITVVGLPAVVGVLKNRDVATSNEVGVVTVLGLLLFGIGMYFETLGDGQLQSFLAHENRPARYLNTGVWTHTRHPHYFGNICSWWGIWLVAVSGNADLWWTAIGPLANTIMLTLILGVALQDKYMGDRPEYQALMARTRALLPLPVKQSPVRSSPAQSPAKEAPVATGHASARD